MQSHLLEVVQLLHPPYRAWIPPGVLEYLTVQASKVGSGGRRSRSGRQTDSCFSRLAYNGLHSRVNHIQVVSHGHIDKQARWLQRLLGRDKSLLAFERMVRRASVLVITVHSGTRFICLILCLCFNI